jgi:hypothetical protein
MVRARMNMGKVKKGNTTRVVQINTLLAIKSAARP